MSMEKIIQEWKSKKCKPIYWLEGDEPYFIDVLLNYAENNLLSPAEAEFNLTIFYGKDAEIASIINACRRYPMLAERQVVILREAQMMRDVEALAPYIEKPQPSTIFVVAYKEKKLDKRKQLSKLIAKQGEQFTSKKLYDNQLPAWVDQMVAEQGLSIQPRARQLMVEHIGNDLARLYNETVKLAVNLGKRKNITEDDIENFIGISKEFNVFELQSAFGQKNLTKTVQIIQYFESNPKAGPIQMILPALFNFFSRVYMLYSLRGADSQTQAAQLGVQPYFISEYQSSAQKYSFQEIERALLLIHHYNLKSVGIHQAKSTDADLMKELAVKIML
ncbi:MAG: DNA polymerase III subunit delta [Chitinophagia bacterium]|nr:DNA polymerase III subunit delta [Chitinophagia bacterium]